MDIKKLSNSLKKKKFLKIDRDEVNKILVDSKLLIEENTYISDKIRLLEYETILFIQEKTTEDEFLIRKVNSRKEGKELIKERLEIYNRMWDGCGCKVDYYN